MSASPRESLPRIACRKEKAIEWLALPGEDRRIVGISGHMACLRRVREDKAWVSVPGSTWLDRLPALQPDLVRSKGDVQADIAMRLVRTGVSPRGLSQRSVAQIVGAPAQTVAARRCHMGAYVAGRQMLRAGRRGLLIQIEKQAGCPPRRLHACCEKGRAPFAHGACWMSGRQVIAEDKGCFSDPACRLPGQCSRVADRQEAARGVPSVSIIGSWRGRQCRLRHMVARAGWAQALAVASGWRFAIHSADALPPGYAAQADGAAQWPCTIMGWGKRDG